jgi:hypothetical protein
MRTSSIIRALTLLIWNSSQCIRYSRLLEGGGAPCSYGGEHQDSGPLIQRGGTKNIPDTCNTDTSDVHLVTSNMAVRLYVLLHGSCQGGCICICICALLQLLNGPASGRPICC